MQETSSASRLAETENARDTEAEALRTELAKWQERVPKLAGALRERTSEVDTLRKELAARPVTTDRGSADFSSSSGIQARDALIEELEAKVRALGGKYQDAEGQLHARDLEITQLRQEAGEWREKWQSVTSSLDEQADSAGHRDRELSRVQQELDELLTLQGTHTGRIKEQDLELTALRERAESLNSRNENLFETTELANRQIETLGENLEHLRSELKASRQALATQETAAGGSAREIEDLKGQIASRDQDIDFLHKHVEEKQSEIARQGEKLNELEPLEAANSAAIEEQDRLSSVLEERDAEIGSLTQRLVEFDAMRQSLEEVGLAAQQADQALASSREETTVREATISEKEKELQSQQEEVRRLEECVARAEEATVRFEVERRQLSGQMDELKKRNGHLEAQLSERSDLVVGLEQEKSAITSKTSSLETENKRLSEALEKSQQAAAGNADHIAQVDARMERQKQLMENLEEEFAEVQEDYAEAVKAHQREISEKAAEAAALREKVDDDSVSALKHELGELEGLLEEAREAAQSAEQEVRLLSDRADKADKAADKSADAARENEARRADEETSRKTLNEKIEQLEKQLHKQSTATAEAEEALAAARAEVEEAEALTSRVPDEVSGENALLQAEVIKLEGMVRERTEQLNKLRWQQDMIEKQGGDDGTDSKMLVVLNQQLQSTRDDNQRLKDRVRELESMPAAVPVVPDDLASIKGIGPKLVKQLRKLGITRFDQIATLSESDLDDKDHPLSGMKGRILKDNWIGQAARLGGGA